MYGKGGEGSVIGGGAVTGAGVIVLPNTHGNTLATILACAAITIGVTAVISQIVVRALRHKYNA
ncbi:MAG TPA: hypothetical protein VLG16_04915 [Candidatus Saccharimonadales bacterium]|nr:hypothetical protein [Candidatus Saccharimonadales bacterium]